MPLKLNLPVTCGLLLLGASLAGPALADVRTGVDAWSRGDYTAAVRQWQGPAESGDPDAMFNLAQAYRMGRGVAADAKRAEDLYARAAAAGHVQAADTYGLLLFQDGRREAALPYLRDAARRGDPRSQYLIGLAYFNGDLLPKDWVRAYALVTLANAEGLSQAAEALTEMDRHIPLAQRQQAAALAQQLRAEADAARNAQLAAFDLATLQPRQPTKQGAPASSAAAPSLAHNQVTVARSPSIAAALEAIAEASRATGTESPAQAGASFARPRATRPAQVAAARPAPAAEAPPKATAKPEAPKSPPPAAKTGPWRVQLGAFSVPANAQRLWQQLSGRAELMGTERMLVSAGGVTRLQAGGFASREAAEAACRALQKSGQACLVPAR